MTMLMEDIKKKDAIQSINKFRFHSSMQRTPTNADNISHL